MFTKQWWNTPPSNSDWFFTRIRKTYQKLRPCKHKWFHPDLFVHGESHGEDPYNRTCVWCREAQYLVYHPYGELRTEWRSKPRLEQWIFE